jgi:tetratricopeptide (TPR) repeat protein
MYFVKEITVAFSDEDSKKYAYLLCDSLEEFKQDTAGVVGAPCEWDAQIGRLPRLEARTNAAQEKRTHINWEPNPQLSQNVIAAMNEVGAVISATVVRNLYGVGKHEEGMREARELVINKQYNGKFYIAVAYIPGYESIFDGTINKNHEEKIEANPDYACAYFDIGLAYQENHDLDRAIENFSRAIKIAPNNVYAYINRGGNYFEKGDFVKAFDDLTQAQKLAPSSKIIKELLFRVQGKKILQKLHERKKLATLGGNNL